jgi:hypothetical protein
MKKGESSFSYRLALPLHQKMVGKQPISCWDGHPGVYFLLIFRARESNDCTCGKTVPGFQARTIFT